MRDTPGRNLTDGEREILNEMQADAAPSKEEQESMREHSEELHAELKAAVAFAEACGEQRVHVDVVYAVAEHCGFDVLKSELEFDIDRNHRARRRWKDVRKGHLEPHEKPDPSDFERQVPDIAYGPGFQITDRVRELKAEAWQKLPNPDQVRIVKEKRSAGGAVRYNVQIEHTGDPTNE